MTPDARRGRKIILFIAAAIVLPQALELVLAVALSNAGETAASSVRLAIAVIGVLLGAGYIWAARVLWKSPAVEAWIEFRESVRNPILSIRDYDGA